jgi:hypothetical protein
MKLVEIKLWHWLAASLLLSIALVWLHASSQEFGDGAWRPGIDQPQFESLLRMTKLPHPPKVFNDLTIYPTIDGKTYVSGEFLINLSDPTHYRKFEMFATNPVDVRAFLKTKYPNVSYTYAWWRDVRVQRAFWFALPVCLIGAICPIVVRRFGAKIEVLADEPAALQPAATIALPDVEAAPPPAPEPEPVPAAVAALSTEPLEPNAVQTQGEEKDYKGQYDPVARNVTPRN